MAEMIEQAVVQAIKDGIKEEMRRDERVVIWGQSAQRGGDMSTTGGIYDEFGGDTTCMEILSAGGFTKPGGEPNRESS